jgi:hypothetical protein
MTSPLLLFGVGSGCESAVRHYADIQPSVVYTADLANNFSCFFFFFSQHVKEKKRPLSFIVDLLLHREKKSQVPRTAVLYVRLFLPRVSTQALLY